MASTEIDFVEVTTWQENTLIHGMREVKAIPVLLLEINVMIFDIGKI
jgi:hypothetical protein